MQATPDSRVEKCICRLAKAYCLVESAVSTHFCRVQHKKPPLMWKLFAIVASRHPQLMDEFISCYAQAVIAQYMVEAHCGSLESTSTIR